MRAGRTLRLTAPTTIGNHGSHLRAGLTEVLQGILDTAETFNSALRVNNDNRNLSERGRAEGQKSVAAAALAKLTAVEETTIKNLTDRAAQLETKLRTRAAVVPPTDPAERIAYELRLQEIRGTLRELSASERLVVFRTTQDEMVLAAYEHAPMIAGAKLPNGERKLEHFIDPIQRTNAVLARGETADPATTATLKDVHSLRESYALAVASTRREILDEVPAALTPALTIYTS